MYENGELKELLLNIFHSEIVAFEWLFQPLTCFDNQCAIELISLGYEDIVLDELYKIQQGTYSN